MKLISSTLRNDRGLTSHYQPVLGPEGVRLHLIFADAIQSQRQTRNR